MMDWNNLGHIMDSDAAKGITAGALGGLVRWVTLRQNWREGIGTVIVGGICALYLGPIVNPLLEPVFGSISPAGDSNGFSSFVVGLGGISISGYLIDVIKARQTKGKPDEKA
jgi:hypothetical protein